MPRALPAVIVIASLCSCVGSVDAQTVFDTSRRVEIARLRLRLYQQVEYPTQLRRLKNELRIAEAEVASLTRLSKEYKPFDKFSTGRPLVLTIESTRLSLLRAELTRDDLRQRLTDHKRFHSDRLRLLSLELEEARSR